MDYGAAKQLKTALSSIETAALTKLVDSQKEHANRNNAWNTGINSIDACLPETGLSRAGLHEIEPLRFGDTPSLTGFVFALLSRLRSSKPIIWCITAQQIGDYGQPYAFGLSRFGISASQIIFTKVSRDKDLPFALEEAIKTDGVMAVIGEGAKPNFTGSRRIALSCKAHQTPCLFITPKQASDNGSAALTRWQVTPQQGVEDPQDPYGPGLPSWAVALPRVRAGRTMPAMDSAELKNTNTSYPWRIAWNDQTLSFCPTSLLCSTATHARGTEKQATAKTLVGRAS